MRILFINGYAFPPQIVGGIEVSTLDLCQSLKKSGHQTAVLCSLIEGNGLWLWNRILGRLTNRDFPMDRHYGIRIYRGWSTIRGLSEVTQREKPDAVVVQGGLINSYEIAAESVRQGFLTFYYTHDVGVIRNQSALPDMTGVRWIANSQFTAKILENYLNVNGAIVPPIFHADSYRIKITGKCVTMINPRPEKGGDIAIRMAELCPDITFKFVEAWGGQHPDVLKLQAIASKLHNVQWLKAQSNMQKIYSDTYMLLMPSQCAETWGRVITEAQFSGIPAIASDIGALPDTVGSGGILLPPTTTPENWAQTLRSVFFNREEYRQLSINATKHSQRDELLPEKVTQKFITILQSGVHQSSGFAPNGTI